jgi:hypothetical protein
VPLYATFSFKVAYYPNPLSLDLCGPRLAKGVVPLQHLDGDPGNPRDVVRIHATRASLSTQNVSRSGCRCASGTSTRFPRLRIRS